MHALTEDPARMLRFHQYTTSCNSQVSIVVLALWPSIDLAVTEREAVACWWILAAFEPQTQQCRKEHEASGPSQNPCTTHFAPDSCRVIAWPKTRQRLSTGASVVVAARAHALLRLRATQMNTERTVVACT